MTGRRPPARPGRRDRLPARQAGPGRQGERGPGLRGTDPDPGARGQARRDRRRDSLGSGHNVTMAELADVVRSIIPDARIEFPTPERRPSYPGTFDNSRAVTEFGWQITGLEQTVRAHIDGVRAQAGLAAAVQP